MSRNRFLTLLAVVVVVLGATAAPGSAATYRHHCFGLYPGGGSYYKINYAAGCYGHDEPDIAPIQSTSGTTSNITWTFYLPKDGTGMSVLSLGPTFWLGTEVTDSASLGGQAFQELQFYPDETLASQATTPTLNSGCGPGGVYNPISSPGKWTICSPTWAVDPNSFDEYAAFNGMVQNASSPGAAFTMNSGDKIQAHIFKGSQSGNPVNVVVKDLTLGTTSATLVLNAGSYKVDTDGPLTTVGGANTATNFLYWGGTQAPPFSISWEIGHPNIFTYPLAPACYPGMFNCYSYNVGGGWQKTTPIKIVGLHFTVGSTTYKPQSWETTDGQGGSQEDIDYCGSYNNSLGGGFCTFPWYSQNGASGASGTSIEFGGTYSGVTNGYGAYTQYARTPLCSGPFGADTVFCAHTVVSGSPIGS